MKNPFTRLLSSSIIYGLGTVLVQLINIILMPLITEHLSPKEYGEIAILNFAYLFVIAIFSLGIGVSLGLCYFDSESKEEKDSLTWSGLMSLLASCALFLVLGISLIQPIGEWLVGREADSVIKYLLIAAIAHILTTPYEARLRLDERPKLFISIAFITTLSIGVPTLIFVISLNRGVVGYFEALAFGRVISLILYLLAVQKGCSRNFDIKKAKRLIVLGSPIVFQFFFLYFLQYGNIEGLKRFLGLEASGIYSVGLTVGMAINVVISSISNAWVPFFLSYAKALDEARVLFGKITTYYLFSVGLLSICFYYFSWPLVALLSADAYAESATIVGPIATGFFLLGLYNMLLPPIFFAKDVHIVTYLLALSSIVLVVLGYFLIPLLGLQGAAWASAGSYLALDIFLISWNNIQGERYFKIRYDISRNLIFGSLYLASIIFLAAVQGNPSINHGIIYALHGGFMGIFVIFLLEPKEREQLKPSMLLKNARIPSWGGD